jgi:hypothetical protein
MSAISRNRRRAHRRRHSTQARRRRHQRAVEQVSASLARVLRAAGVYSITNKKEAAE